MTDTDSEEIVRNLVSKEEVFYPWDIVNLAKDEGVERKESVGVLHDMKISHKIVPKEPFLGNRGMLAVMTDTQPEGSSQRVELLKELEEQTTEEQKRIMEVIEFAEKCDELSEFAEGLDEQEDSHRTYPVR